MNLKKLDLKFFPAKLKPFKKNPEILQTMGGGVVGSIISTGISPEPLKLKVRNINFSQIEFHSIVRKT